MLNPEIHELVGRGESADVYRISGGQVVKLFREGVPEGLMQREYDAATLAHGLGLRVARPVGWHGIAGRRGIIFEDLPYADIQRQLRFRPLSFLRALWRLAQYQAAMHRIDSSGTGDLPRQHHALHRRISTAQVPESLRREALRRLAELPDGDRLCHGDLHPGNAIDTKDGLAVIDWLNASIGHPLADAARTELLIRYGRHGKWLKRFGLLRLVRHITGWWYLTFYSRAAGVRRADIAAWRLPVAVAWVQAKTSVNVVALRRSITAWQGQSAAALHRVASLVSSCLLLTLAG